MRVRSRRKAIAFFVALGVCSVALAVALNVSWIILNWRAGVLLLFGVIFFAAIIAGMILNTGFLVREIRRNEQHDSFINAVTHELKTPIASIRLYLETLQRREVDEAQRQQFYQVMLNDADRLLGTVDQVLKAGQVGYKHPASFRTEIDFGNLVRDCIELARTRHHLQSAALHYQESKNGSGIEVQGDPEELRTAVSNLLDNAIKYSGATIDVNVQLDIPDESRCPARPRPRRGESNGRTQAHLQTLLSRPESFRLSREGNRLGIIHRSSHCQSARRQGFCGKRRSGAGHYRHI